MGSPLDLSGIMKIELRILNYVLMKTLLQIIVDVAVKIFLNHPNKKNLVLNRRCLHYKLEKQSADKTKQPWKCGKVTLRNDTLN